MRFKIDWASLIVGSKFTVFALFYFVFEGLYLEGRFNEQFLRYRFGGLIFGGAHPWRGLFSEFYSPFLVKTSFICMRMENPFHINVHFGWLASHQGCIEYLHNGDNE